MKSSWAPRKLTKRDTPVASIVPIVPDCLVESRNFGHRHESKVASLRKTTVATQTRHHFEVNRQESPVAAPSKLQRQAHALSQESSGIDELNINLLRLCFDVFEAEKLAFTGTGAVIARLFPSLFAV